MKKTTKPKIKLCKACGKKSVQYGDLCDDCYFEGKKPLTDKYLETGNSDESDGLQSVLDVFDKEIGRDKKDIERDTSFITTKIKSDIKKYHGKDIEEIKSDRNEEQAEIFWEDIIREKKKSKLDKRIASKQEEYLNTLSRKELIDLLITKDDLLDKAKKFEDIVDKANKASTLLVGSEYFNDPAFIITKLQNMVREKSECILRQVGIRKKAEKELNLKSKNQK